MKPTVAFVLALENEAHPERAYARASKNAIHKAVMRGNQYEGEFFEITTYVFKDGSELQITETPESIELVPLDEQNPNYIRVRPEDIEALPF